MDEEKTLPNIPQKDIKTRLTVIIGFLLLVIVCLLIYIFLPNIKSFGKEMFPNLGIWEEDSEEEISEDTNEVENAEEEEDATTEQTEEFTGEYITATLPEGWNIIEYTDGDGTDMLTDTLTYTGLTGIEILNADSEVVFTIEAVYGIGFAGCGDYAVFLDDNQSYYDEQRAMNDEIGEAMNEHDFTNTEYSEFVWFGTTMRRIEDTYYYDTINGDSYFEPSCTPSLKTLSGLTFEVDGYTGDAYSYGLTNNATESEYTTVDGILESMEVI